FRVGIVRPQEPADQERDGDKQRADSEKNSDTGVLLEHAAASSSLRRTGCAKAVGPSHNNDAFHNLAPKKRPEARRLFAGCRPFVLGCQCLIIIGPCTGVNRSPARPTRDFPGHRRSRFTTSHIRCPRLESCPKRENMGARKTSSWAARFPCVIVSL